MMVLNAPKDSTFENLEFILTEKCKQDGNLNDYAMEYILSQLFKPEDISNRIRNRVKSIINKVTKGTDDGRDKAGVA